MCMPKTPKVQSVAAPPQIIDTTSAQQAESATRKRRAGYANLFKTGSRLGDMGQPSISVKSLLGGTA